MVRKPTTRKRGTMKRRSGGTFPSPFHQPHHGQGGFLNSLSSGFQGLRNRYTTPHSMSHPSGFGGSKRRTKRRRGKAKKSKKRGKGKGKSRRRRH